MDDPKLLFGQKLRKLRVKRNWTQEELSFQSGLSRTYLGEVECGKRNIALENICKLAKALDLTPDKLLKF